MQKGSPPSWLVAMRFDTRTAEVGDTCSLVQPPRHPFTCTGAPQYNLSVPARCPRFNQPVSCHARPPIRSTPKHACSRRRAHDTARYGMTTTQHNRAAKLVDNVPNQHGAAGAVVLSKRAKLCANNKEEEAALCRHSS